MKNSTRIFLILFTVLLFAYGLNLWIQTSPWVYDYKLIQNRDTELELVMAFATALRINHPAAYDMIDPNLKPRLDEWMNSHQRKKCVQEAVYFFVSDGSKEGKKIEFGCTTEISGLSYEIDNIVIKDMKVIDWGEVTEEFYGSFP